MNRTVLIVDDEEDARELLKVHLKRHPQMEVIGEASNGLEAIDLIQRSNPDIVFLDIQMPEMNGIEVAEKVQEVPIFVFVTAYDEFAVKAFELNSLDYLLKPVSDARFDQTIKRIETNFTDDGTDERYHDLVQNVIASISKQVNFLQRFTYRSGLKTIFIAVGEVILIESADQYVEVHTLNSKYLLRLSMDYLEHVLDPALFFRTHRSFIVKLNEVASIEQYEPRNYIIHLGGEKKAKLARDKKDELNRLLTGT